MKTPSQLLLHRGESDLWLLHHASATTLKGLFSGSRAGVLLMAGVGSEEILKPSYLSLPPPDLDWGLHSNIRGSE